MAKADCTITAAQPEVSEDLNGTLAALDRALNLVDGLAYKLFGDDAHTFECWPDPIADRIAYAHHLVIAIEDTVERIATRLG